MFFGLSPERSIIKTLLPMFGPYGVGGLVFGGGSAGRVGHAAGGPPGPTGRPAGRPQWPKARFGIWLLTGSQRPSVRAPKLR